MIRDSFPSFCFPCWEEKYKEGIGTEHCICYEVKCPLGMGFRGGDPIQRTQVGVNELKVPPCEGDGQ